MADPESKESGIGKPKGTQHTGGAEGKLYTPAYEEAGRQGKQRVDDISDFDASSQPTSNRVLPEVGKTKATNSSDLDPGEDTPGAKPGKPDKKAVPAVDASDGRTPGPSADTRKPEVNPAKSKTVADPAVSEPKAPDSKSKTEPALQSRTEQSLQKPELTPQRLESLSHKGLERTSEGFSPAEARTIKSGHEQVTTALAQKRDELAGKKVEAVDARDSGAPVVNQRQGQVAAAIPEAKTDTSAAHATVKPNPQGASSVVFERPATQGEKSPLVSSPATRDTHHSDGSSVARPATTERPMEGAPKGTLKSEFSEPDAREASKNKIGSLSAGSADEHSESKSRSTGKDAGIEQAQSKSHTSAGKDEDGRTGRGEGQPESKSGGIRSDKDGGIRSDKDGIREAFGEKNEPGQKTQHQGAEQKADGQRGTATNRPDDSPIRKESDPREAKLDPTGKEPDTRTSASGKIDGSAADARMPNPKSQDGSDARVPGGKATGGGDSSGSAGGILLTDEKSGRRVDGKTPTSKGEGVGGGPADGSTGRRPHGELIPELSDHPTDKTSVRDGKNLMPPSLVMVPESFTIKGRISEIVVALLGTRRAISQQVEPQGDKASKTQPGTKVPELVAGKGDKTPVDKDGKAPVDKGDKAPVNKGDKTPVDKAAAGKEPNPPRLEGITSAVKVIQRIFDLLPTDQIARTSRILRIKRQIRDNSETSGPRPILPGNVFVPKVGFVRVGRTLSTMFGFAPNKPNRIGEPKSTSDSRSAVAPKSNADSRSAVAPKSSEDSRKAGETREVSPGTGSAIKVNVGQNVFEEPASGRKAFAGRGSETKPIFNQAPTPGSAARVPDLSDQKSTRPGELPADSDSVNAAPTAGRPRHPGAADAERSSDAKARFTEETSKGFNENDHTEVDAPPADDDQLFAETVEIPDVKIVDAEPDSDEMSDPDADETSDPNSFSELERDDASSGRYQYVVQPGDTIESLSTTLLGDIRLAPLLFEKAREFVMAEQTYGCHELLPGSVIDLPTPLEIERFKQNRGWT